MVLGRGENWLHRSLQSKRRRGRASREEKAPDPSVRERPFDDAELPREYHTSTCYRLETDTPVRGGRRGKKERYSALVEETVLGRTPSNKEDQRVS